MACAGLGVAAAWVQPSFAASFPDHPVKIVVPAAPGGALDTISRLLAFKASDIAKQKFYVENKPGANWIIGMDAVARAPADGYTLLFMASSGMTVNPYIFHNMPLDPAKDLKPITIVTDTPFVLLANPSVPAKNLSEFISYLKANPGKLNHASNSSTTMLMSELFKQRAGVDYVDVNFRGASKAMQATLAGTTQFCFVDLGSGTSAIKAKTLRPLGLTSPQSYSLSGIPSMAEQGLHGYSASAKTLVFAPAKTPAPIMDKLNGIFREALKVPDLKSRLNTMGQVVVGDSAEDALKQLQPEAEQWKTLIKERHITFGQQ
jgi:tripartite-type tricarboxylate transporter receptor subunit TctC